MYSVIIMVCYSEHSHILYLHFLYLTLDLVTLQDNCDILFNLLLFNGLWFPFKLL